MRVLCFALMALMSMLPGCGALFPVARDTEQRLARFPTSGLPLESAVTIRWNRYAVPYIEAASDRDLAFSLGLVHAHLREGQLAFAKRIVYGRLSEMAGRFARDFDRTLRIIDFPGAGAAIEARLPAETRVWLQGFVDGLNWYQAHVRQTPPEYGLLGLSRETWSVRDLLAIGRLAGTDINWSTYFGLIGDRDTPAWPTIWRRVLDGGAGGAVSFDAADKQAAIESLLLGFSRSGSNCVVVSPTHSATGGALLASDPHLPLVLPNLWILAGVRSPSYNVVGLMPAGLPIFGLGRSAQMAWGGTNMRAAVSDLYDASHETLESRDERLLVRLWPGETITLRRSRLGPILSDAPQFKAPPGATIALRWMGHAPSDEITAFLKASRAGTPDEFRAAFATYAVGPQNMQFADSAGNIGQIMAVWLPRRRYRRPPDLVLDPRDPATDWDGYETSVDLPWALNPARGFLASANNPPTETDTPVGFFFITSERVERLQTLLATKPKLSIEDLRALQHDVVSPASSRLRQALEGAIDAAGLAREQPAFMTRLRDWNGSYDVANPGPVAFETLLFHVFHGLNKTETPPLRADWSQIVTFLPDALAALPPAQRDALLRTALSAAATDAKKFSTWGDMHVMRVQSVLANVPVIGGRFRIAEYPVGGSRETVMKTFHGMVNQRHAAVYGSQSRFIADMSDPDASWFVLFGGQDGWLGSANFADQLPLWRDGGTIQMPLTPEAVARAFPRVQRLQPAG